MAGLKEKVKGFFALNSSISFIPVMVILNVRVKNAADFTVFAVWKKTRVQVRTNDSYVSTAFKSPPWKRCSKAAIIQF
ncbi:MAG: hypothetical protein ABRQ26_01020 [Syntrophomonadaceae bacterium]